jgi:chromosome segregation ATPase
MSNKTKQSSPLIKSVLALQDDLYELERLGGKINSEDLSVDFDVEYFQKLIARFAECGQRLATEMAAFSSHLQEAQARAEATAASVSRQTQLFKTRTDEQNEKLETFRRLGERVQELNSAISQFQPSQGDRAAVQSHIRNLEAQLAGVIGELQDLRNSARESRMKGLEKQAHALAQSLQAVQVKLRDATPPDVS